MSYMSRPHSDELRQSLKDHGMDTTRPSQLSDAFRLGFWAAERSPETSTPTVAQLQARVAELEAKLTSLMASAFDLNFIAANDDGLDVNGKTASAISKHYHKARNS